MPDKLHIDIETFSSVPITISGAYKYMDSVDFEILLVSYAFNDGDIQIVDLMQGEYLPDSFINALLDQNVIKCAHNAAFERRAFKMYGYDIPAGQWECTAIKSSYCGLPLALDSVSKILNLEEKGKLSTGKALIRYFSIPCKPTKANGQRFRNLPEHDPAKWEEFKRYCKNDVKAEREISNTLKKYKFPNAEQYYYIIDQDINDKGVLIDLNLVDKAIKFDEKFLSKIKNELKEITGVNNPNSPAQLKDWLSKVLGKNVNSLNKESVQRLIDEISSRAVKKIEGFVTMNHDYASDLTQHEKEDLLRKNNYEDYFDNGLWVKRFEEDANRVTGIPTDELVNIILNWLNREIREYNTADVLKVLEGRLKISKSSTKKYKSMVNCACDDSRGHGLFQFHGAGRTGRWASRLVQLQNLPRNEMDDLELARDIVKSGDYDLFEMLYGNVSNTLSELIRTALIAPDGYKFVVADFSAIEARVLSWLANEQWRLEVFRTHGKIYEASAALMFGVPIESIDKGSDLRQRGKTAELALGYQGAVGAMDRVDVKSKIPHSERSHIVKKWREANPKIVQFWSDIENCAKYTIRSGNPSALEYLKFYRDKQTFQIELPSGRKLFYYQPGFGVNRFGMESITFKGLKQGTKKWGTVETYGGSLTENVVQAISRDLLANSMLNLTTENFNLVMHVHDENIAEEKEEKSKERLSRMIEIMTRKVSWAPGLPLAADGYITNFYKKA